MWLACDIIAFVIIAAFAILGAWRGLIRAIISLVLTAAAAVIAVMASAPVAEYVYDGYIKDAVITQVQSSFESVDLVPTVKEGIKEHVGVEISDEDIERIAQSDDILSEIQDIAAEHGESISTDEMKEKLDELVSSDSIGEIVGDSVPAEVVESITTTLQENRDNIDAVIKALCDSDSEAAAKQIEESLVRDQVTFMIRGIAGIMIFVCVDAVLLVIFTLLSKLKVIPPIKKISKAAGLVIGLAEGVIVMIVIGICLRYVIDNSYGIITSIGNGIIDKTILFKHFL